MSAGRGEVVRVSDWHSVRKAVYYDLAYPASWVNGGAELAKALVGEGFVPLNAFQLAAWLKAQIDGGADGSICFFARDIVPDQAAGDYSPDCLLARYMKAGGRVVWVGDVPFYYQGRSGGGAMTWGTVGQKTALGLDSVFDVKEPAELTPEGAQWGLTCAEEPARCVPAADVTAVLTRAGKYAVSFFKNYNSEFPYSGFVRLRETLPLNDLLRAAQYGIEEAEAEAAGAPSAEALPVEEGAELVDSGSFLVDRTRALDKLMRFQLPDPETCLLPLARAADAAGSQEVSISEGMDGVLTVNFTGVPFTKEQLADPYAPLFEPRSPANAAGRHLATALLCALRLNPKSVTISSGPEGDRHRLIVRELGKEELQVSESPGGETSVKIAWGGPFSGLTSRNLLKHVRARCLFSPVKVVLNGRYLDRAPLDSGGGAGLEFKSGALRGYIEPTPWPSETSSITVLVNGVSLDIPLNVKLRGLQLRGRVDSPDFTMNISQTGVVNNTRCSRALAAVQAALPALVEKVAAAQEKNLPASAKLAVRTQADLWRERMSGARPLLPGLLTGLAKGVRSLLVWEPPTAKSWRETAERVLLNSAAATRWLQDGCAALLTKWETDSADPLLRTLWNAPVFITVNGEARTMREIEAQRQRMGFVPYSMAPDVGAVLPFAVVWCTGFRELSLLRRWETADITRKLPYYGRNPAAAEEFMGCAGSGLVAMRHDIELVPPERLGRPGGVEINLSVAEPERKAERGPRNAPPPGPRPAAPAPVPEPVKPKAPKKKTPPLPGEDALSGDPQANFPEYLARFAFNSIDATGARMLAKYIREQGADKSWCKRRLRAVVLGAGLPPKRQAEYLLSVFYTEFNRREVRFTDSDDIRFQQALAETVLRGGENGRKERGSAGEGA